MSYRCGSCGKAIARGKPQFKIMTQTRQAQYSNGGVGSETVEEVGVCPDCKPKMPQATVVAEIAKVETPRPALKKGEERKKRY
jgi:hypothetical protein